MFEWHEKSYYLPLRNNPAHLTMLSHYIILLNIHHIIILFIVSLFSSSFYTKILFNSFLFFNLYNNNATIRDKIYIKPHDGNYIS